MKNRSADITLAPSNSFGFVKRLTLAGIQVFLDVALYLACFNIVRVLWYPETAPFLAERELFFGGVVLVCFFFHSLYSFRTWLFWDEMREVLKASAAALVIVIMYLFAFKLQMSRITVVAGTALFVPTCLLVRYAVRRAAVAAGFLKTCVLIIGAGKAGEIYAQKVAAHPFMGCRVIGFLDDDPRKQGTRVADSPVLGGLDDFEKVVPITPVCEVVVAISTANRELLARVLNIVEMRVKRVSYIPDMYMLTTFSASMHDIDGLPIISASQGLLNPMNRLLKSVMDYCGAVVALILFSPVFLYAAYRIKKDDGGEVLFGHNRMKQNLNAAFPMYKFRSMVPNAEELLKEMMKDEKLKQEYEIAFKFKNDPRITKIGRFLRKTSLDELPQLFNVLRGEMSLIGPRPLSMQEINVRYGDIAQQIYCVKPGVTGFWQVSGRSDVLDYQQRIDLELYYIHNWSLWLDIVILFRTVQILIRADGAY